MKFGFNLHIALGGGGALNCHTMRVLSQKSKNDLDLNLHCSISSQMMDG